MAAATAVLCAVSLPPTAGGSPAAAPTPPSGELTVPDGAVLVGPSYAEIGGVQMSAVSLSLR